MTHRQTHKLPYPRCACAPRVKNPGPIYLQSRFEGELLTCTVIHQSPDASNHRTPSKYRTEIQVIPTCIHLRLLPAESAFTAARNAHLLHQGFDCRARQAGHFTLVELAVFLPGSTKCKSIATVRTCVWQKIQMSKRLVPASPFTYYTFSRIRNTTLWMYNWASGSEPT